MGTGRMADIGAPIGEVLVSAVAAMSLGGLVAGVATAWVAAARGPIDSLCRVLPGSACRLVVLVSGAGTNLQALLDACGDPAYGAPVVAVGADRDGIEGLARAERAGVPTFVRKVGQFNSRGDWDPRSPTPSRPSTPTSSCWPGS